MSAKGTALRAQLQLWSRMQNHPESVSNVTALRICRSSPTQVAGGNTLWSSVLGTRTGALYATGTGKLKVRAGCWALKRTPLALPLPPAHAMQPPAALYFNSHAPERQFYDRESAPRECAKRSVARRGRAGQGLAWRPVKSAPQIPSNWTLGRQKNGIGCAPLAPYHPADPTRRKVRMYILC